MLLLCCSSTDSLPGTLTYDLGLRKTRGRSPQVKGRLRAPFPILRAANRGFSFSTDKAQQPGPWYVLDATSGPAGTRKAPVPESADYRQRRRAPKRQVERAAPA